MIGEAIQKLVEGQNLTEQEATAVMNEIMTGEAAPTQVACFLTALRMKGETVEEITGFAKVMREKAVRISCGRKMLVDTCGTGGDLIKTFNISTAAAFVVAGAGVAVAKHGNRSVTSKSGSADVLEALGINLKAEQQQAGQCIDEIGIGFLFAPAFHPAMKYALPIRKEIGIRTVFNILGPLTNPAGAQAQVLGVYHPDLTELMAGVLGNLGSRRAFVVHGMGGLDEISTFGETKISELKDGKVSTYQMTPDQFGIPEADIKDLAGGTAEENADILKAIFDGQPGPQRDIVLLNAAAALVAAGKAADFSEGIAMGAQSIDQGQALAKLEQLRDHTNA